MTSEKAYLIVSGVARSGTTALGELLNAHPDICLGIERFKFQYLRAHNFSRTLFEHDRFFDFRPEDTNLDPDKRPAWKPVYTSIEEKWDTARIIGDKVPDLLPVLVDFMTENPDYRFICILRNLKDVGLSWQTRADKPRDAWPKEKGFVEACKSWAEQHAFLHDLMRHRPTRQKVLLLDYDTMYQDLPQTEAAILGFLGLERNEAFTGVLHQHSAFINERPNRKIPKKYIEAYKAVEQGHIRGLRKVAREQAQIWADAFHERGQS